MIIDSADETLAVHLLNKISSLQGIFQKIDSIEAFVRDVDREVSRMEAFVERKQGLSSKLFKKAKDLFV